MTNMTGQGGLVSCLFLTRFGCMHAVISLHAAGSAQNWAEFNQRFRVGCGLARAVCGACWCRTQLDGGCSACCALPQTGRASLVACVCRSGSA